MRAEVEMSRILAAVWFLALALGVGALPRTGPTLRTGDVVLQTSRSAMSGTIEIATRSPWSHVGIVEVGPRGPFVIEAVGPVKRTAWRKWRARGEGGRVLVLRPRDLSPDDLARVASEARRELGKPYDPAYGWGDDAFYCSELVYKAFLRGTGAGVGRLERLGDLRIGGLEAAIAARNGGKVPLDLQLVTPASIAADPRLERVGPEG
jgi:hypothetical protein